ncbi:MAG: hypothetical protein J4F28_00590 [Nitrosopumilaceae archaeon]|nr:hypothetical protein [Nitrosopumilaceae archaeon]
MLILAASPYAYAQAVDLADARSDTSDGGPGVLEYESSGLNVTGAELLDFPFLSISIEFTDDAGDRALTVFLADPLFDPVFDTDGYQLDVITDVGLHDSFETSGRNMTITNLPVGIETIDIYLSARDVAGDAVPDGDSSTAQDPNLDGADADASGDEAADDDGTAQDQVTDAPEDVAGEEQSAPEDVTGDVAVDDGSDDSDVAGGMPSEAGEPPDGADTPGEVPPQPAGDGPASGEPSTGCGPGTVLVDGVCVLEEQPESDMEQEAESYTAPAPQNGGSDARADARGLIFGAAGGFLAAGIIAVILALIYRADRRKH